MDMILKQKMEQWVDEHFDEMLTELTTLAKIPSVSKKGADDLPFGRECLNALGCFCEIAARQGLETKIIDSICAEASQNAEAANEDSLCLWCHIDVVPAGEGWTYTTPFEPVIKGDYMIGRGVDDNKGPAVACLYVLRMLKELGVETKHTIKLCVGTDEEVGMEDVKHYVSVRPAAALNVVADCGFPVCFAEKGIIEAELTSAAPLKEITAFKAGLASNIIPDKAEMVINAPARKSGQLSERASVTLEGESTKIAATGIPAHSAAPKEGINAIHELTEAAISSGALSPEAHRVFEFYTRVNDDYLGTELGIAFSDEVSGITTCAGTMARLTEDGKAALHINIRYSVSADKDRMIKSIEAACEKNGCELKSLHVNEPNYFPPDAPVVVKMTDVFNELTGLETKPYAMSGGTYARKLPNAIAYGMGGLKKPETDLFQPGHGGAHQADEALYLPNLKKAMTILAMAITEADKVI